MKFRNLTPFDVMCFSALAPDGQEHPVIAMKVGYRLEPVENQPGRHRTIVIDNDPLPLCKADTYYDEPGTRLVYASHPAATESNFLIQRRPSVHRVSASPLPNCKSIRPI